MGVGIVHIEPLWAQNERKLIEVYAFRQFIDSVWDIMLYVGDRMEFVDSEIRNQFSKESMIVNPLNDPCFFSGGDYEGFTITYALLGLGYPYYLASNKDNQGNEETTYFYTQEKKNDKIDIVQMWTWFEMGEACCKIITPDDDDWFSSILGSLSIYQFSSTFGSEYLANIESMLYDGEAYVPEKKYPVGSWDQIDVTRLLYWQLMAAGQ